jgi:tRNA(Ile2) C34 agmatinyltransferase TiaS
VIEDTEPRCKHCGESPVATNDADVKCKQCGLPLSQHFLVTVIEQRDGGPSIYPPPKDDYQTRGAVWVCPKATFTVVPYQ